MKPRISVRELCQIGLFTAVIAVCAQFTIPLPGMVPFTLQAWAICLAGLVLGPKNGTIAAIIYVLLGAVGAPVFAQFSGGMGVILRHTGGFILSFPLVALLAGLGERTGKLPWVFAGLAAGTLVNWLVGMLYFSLVLSTSLAVAFTAAVLPFIPSAALRVILLPFVSKGIKAALSAARVHS
ncbi:MAG: biotin transporter BioY [Oscillospiraceae bacterium]|nr:biotin transporter BioY [Oscillospiraceae bacterium]